MRSLCIDRIQVVLVSAAIAVTASFFWTVLCDKTSATETLVINQSMTKSQARLYVANAVKDQYGSYQRIYKRSCSRRSFRDFKCKIRWISGAVHYSGNIDLKHRIKTVQGSDYLVWIDGFRGKRISKACSYSARKRKTVCRAIKRTVRWNSKRNWFSGSQRLSTNSVAHWNGLAKFSISTNDIPPEVSRERFVDLVRKVGEEYGLIFTGAVHSVSPANLSHTVGFDSRYHKKTKSLGRLVRNRTPKMRSHAVKCISGIGSDRLRSNRRFYEPIYDSCLRRFGDFYKYRAQRIILNPNVRWEDGPVHPSSREYDLERTIRHEFGHWVGKKHFYGCENSPMTIPTHKGEWWRSATDWKRKGCN